MKGLIGTAIAVALGTYLANWATTALGNSGS